MIKGRIITILCLLFILIFSGCTDKNNPVGLAGHAGPVPTEIEIGSEHFSHVYSYEDSISIFNSEKIIMGNYEVNGFSNQAVCLLKFTSLIDTFYQEINNTKLVLYINERSNFDVIDNTTLKIGKVTKNWYETTADWFEPTDSTTWTNDTFSLNDGDDFELIDFTVEYDDADSISIELPDELVENWILQDSLNFGLAIFTEDADKFIEFSSSEMSDSEPKLFFDYQETAEDTVVTAEKVAVHDIQIFASDYEFNVFPNNLIISNIQPVRLTMKFDLPPSIFAAADTFNTTIDDTVLYMQRLSINRAELVLAFDQSIPTAYPLSASINIDPYLMTTDSLNFDNLNEPLICDDDYTDLYISSTKDSLQSGEFRINITSIVQALSSGTYDNYGIMLRSIYENYDFRHTQFTAEPKLDIVFTPPYLDE
ncbi:MAG TPA: DNRLRE domain-containing protein [Candidatus Cloacimonadota bacterium]|nr:DNRLRE domain-containing protein [Candidatus Cloacimonadota bacterium]